ncbi:MAG: glycosyltransferase family 2 protein [Alphaproteobacteria bacterium]|nr:glycosyltransferase family 2 protein [Alphaproteobacteria bacterium]
MPNISLIIPNYNNGRYLDDCLKSVLNQTVTDWECIIIDDGSDDDSRAIIEKYCRRDKRFKSVYQSRRGVSAARNVGMDMAAGQWISFLDADDMLLPAAFEIMLHGASMRNADIVEGGTTTVHAEFRLPKLPAVFNPHAVNVLLYENLFTDLPKYCYNVAWTWRRLYRADMVKHIRFPENIEINEDLLWFLDVLAMRPLMVQVNQVVLYHRVWRDSVTRGAGPLGRVDQLLTVIERIDENRALPRYFLNSVIFNLMRCIVDFELNEINVDKSIMAPQLRRRLLAHARHIKMLPRHMRRFARLFLFKQYLLHLVYGHGTD